MESEVTKSKSREIDIPATSDQLSKFILEYIGSLKSKGTEDASVINMLESIPTVLTFFKNKTTILEQDLQGLVELVSQYKDKVSKDNEKAKILVTQLENENKMLKSKLFVLEDTMIRIEANTRRKQHLERITKEIESEDKKISEVIQTLSVQDKNWE